MHWQGSLTWEAPIRKGVGDARMASMFAPGGWVSGSGAAAWQGDRYQQVLRYQGWTYIGVRTICEAFAGLPAHVGFARDDAYAEKLKDRGHKFLDPQSRRKAIVAQQSDEIETATKNYPLVRLLANPNDPDVGWTFRYRTMLYLELTGNAYWWKIRNMLGQVVQMYVVPSHWMRAIGGETTLVDSYEIRPFGGSSRMTTTTVPASDVVHFSYPGPLSIIDGWSPLQASALWSDTAQSIDVARLADMKQGTRARLIIGLDPKFGTPDAEVINRMQSRLEERICGEVNSGRPTVLEGGIVPHLLNRNPAEMDYVDSSNQVSRDWTLAIHGVSKTIPGITEDVNYAGFVASLARFCNGTIKPKLTMIGEISTEKLAHEFDPSALIYWPDPTPPDADQVNRDITTDVAASAVAPNEVRKLRGREAFPYGGDDPLLPLGVSPSGWATGDIPEPEPVGFEGDDIDTPDIPDPIAERGRQYLNGKAPV